MKQLTFTTMGGETITIKPKGKHYTQPRGYFYHPGTGPKGETCGTCKHCVRERNYRGTKTWAKCDLARARWTGGRGTDILIKAAACKYWESC